jgi:hypothetical protein
MARQECSLACEGLSSELFAAAREPKNLVTVAARDHKYSGNTDGFFRALQEGMSWIELQHH